MKSSLIPITIAYIVGMLTLAINVEFTKNFYSDAKKAIAECQKDLPRSSTCVIYAKESKH